MSWPALILSVQSACGRLNSFAHHGSMTLRSCSNLPGMQLRGAKLAMAPMRQSSFAAQPCSASRFISCVLPLQDVDLEGEATPGRAMAKGTGECEKGSAATILESPERARPGSARPPETPEQAAEGELNLDTATHSPVLDPGTPEQPM